MELQECVAAVSIDVSSATVDDVARVLGTLARLRRLLDGVEIACLRRLEELATADPSINPEHLHAAASRRSVRVCTRVTRRAKAAAALPALAGLVASGDVSGEHLDAFARAVRGLPEALRPTLVALEPVFAAIAVGCTVEEFADRLAAEARRIEADDGVDRLERQRRRNRVRQWTDRDGMWRLSGCFDPATGLPLQQLLQQRTEALFHGPRPEHCPDDPVAAHECLQALALAELITRPGEGPGGAEIIVTIDEESWIRGRRHERSRIDCGHGIDLPVTAIRSLAEVSGRTRFVPVVLDQNGVVIRQGRPVPTFDQLRESLLRPVCLDAGRSRRYATRDQRRALRAMYRRCAIPGCDGHVSRTHPHHVEFWSTGGATDLHVLLPVCPHCHHRIHHEGWDLTLAPDRSLVVRRRGEVIMSTGPPADHWR